MGKELGRISGALLSENLLRVSRSGATTVYNNLAFDNNLLYLNVETRRIGINTTSPTRDLLIPTDIESTNLIVTELSEIANFTISSNQIQDPLGTITISPLQLDPIITTPGLGTSALTFNYDNHLTGALDSNINFTPSGSGVINIRNNTTVNGDVHATGNITWDGDITLGNELTDTITLKSDINSNVVPNVTGVDTVISDYNLGSSDLRWATLYAKTNDTITINANLASASIGQFGNIKFENNIISNTVSTNDITLLSPDRSVNFDNIEYVNGNDFVYGSMLTLSSTASGHFNFTGSNGIVIPSGSTIGPEGVETGMIRYNTDLGYVRVFNGTNWQPVGGESVTLTQDEVTDVMWAWDLILG